MTLEELLDMNEALDVWSDINDLDVTSPVAAGFTGQDTAILRI